MRDDAVILDVTLTLKYLRKYLVRKAERHVLLLAISLLPLQDFGTKDKRPYKREKNVLSYFKNLIRM